MQSGTEEKSKTLDTTNE